MAESLGFGAKQKWRESCVVGGKAVVWHGNSSELEPTLELWTVDRRTFLDCSTTEAIGQCAGAVAGRSDRTCGMAGVRMALAFGPESTLLAGLDSGMATDGSVAIVRLASGCVKSFEASLRYALGRR